MRKEVPEDVANAIKTIRSFCDDGLYKDCDGCPFYYSSTSLESSCLFNIVCPACCNVNDEKHYYIEYNERSKTNV